MLRIIVLEIQEDRDLTGGGRRILVDHELSRAGSGRPVDGLHRIPGLVFTDPGEGERVGKESPSLLDITEGDGKNAIMAALSAHPSLKHCVVVDTDVNVFDAEDVEYAISTRVKGDRDIMIVPNVRGSSLDPVAESDGTTTKIGVDATKSLKTLEKFERVSFGE